MSRLSLFNSPLLLGFERIERSLDRVSKTSADGYPPYNIEKTADDRLRITLAVAGFTDDDLNIQVEGDQLIIRGKQADEDQRTFLHRGIATRQFQRSFVLAEGIEVVAATMDNGLLHVDLHRPLPEKRVQTIAIQRGDNRAAAKSIDVGKHGAPAKQTDKTKRHAATAD